MKDERRGTPRVSGPFDASWSGHSGAGTCRVTDISEGGCFVETWAAPVVGERVTVQPRMLAERPDISLAGVVVYTIPGFGFAVRFSPGPDGSRELREILNRIDDSK